MTGLGDILRQSLDAGEPSVVVTLAETLGSTPRDAGVQMLVLSTQAIGTIGGGRLEYEAICAARRLIESGATDHEMEIALGPSIGQCCGGHVSVRFERADLTTLKRIDRLEQDERAALPNIYLYGAGHVGKAIANALAPLPVRLVWVDSRAEEFPDPIPSGVMRLVSSDPVARLRNAEVGAGVLILTHSHALDFELAEAALRRTDLSYAGLIGSATKRRRFERWYVARGGAPGDLGRLVCPIGAGLNRDKRPAVIAAMVAAELLVATDRAADRIVPFSDRRKFA